MKNKFYIFIAMMGALALASCSTIDDDLSGCDNNYELDYELRLVTNLTTELRTELQTELNTEADLKIAAALRSYLMNIFTDYARDVNLSFYDTKGDSIRLEHFTDYIYDNRATYTLNLPKRQYMHLAVANVADNQLVGIGTDDYCHTAQLITTNSGYTTTPDTIGCHTTGLFTARQPMEVLDSVNQTFNVHLYMANCAACLVVDTIDSGIEDIRVFTTGFASAFNICDSTFLFNATPPVVRTTKITDGEKGSHLAFCSVNFPSKPAATAHGASRDKQTRLVIDINNPFVKTVNEDSPWKLDVYVKTANGSITRTELFVNQELHAGEVKVLKAKITPNGAATLNGGKNNVGVNITLNWNSAGEYNPVL